MIVWLQNKKFLTYLRLLAFAAKLCTSSGVKRLRWLPDWLPTTTGFCCETLHQFWCETFTVIAWLTTYDHWRLWLSDEIPLWLLGYRKNEWVRSNSRWQALTSEEKVTTRTRYQSGLYTVAIAYLKTWTVLFFIPQQKGPCLLSGVYVNDERENHPPHVETRVKDCKRYLNFWVRDIQP